MNETHFHDANALTRMYLARIHQIKQRQATRIENLENMWRRDLRAMDRQYHLATLRRDSRVTTNLEK